LAWDALVDFVEWLAGGRLANKLWFRALCLAAALRPIPLKSTSDATLATSNRFISVIIEFLSFLRVTPPGMRVSYRNISRRAVDGEADVR
jgi:hypothetical protein